MNQEDLDLTLGQKKRIFIRIQFLDDQIVTKVCRFTNKVN